jgi:hypothetical protein
METRQPTLTTPSAATLPPVPLWWGVAALAAGLVCAAVWIWSSFLGLALVVALVGGVSALAGARHPIALIVALWAVAPFNYGKGAAGAVLKLSEGVAGLMLVVILVHLAAGSGAAWERLRRGAGVVGALALLCGLAVVTAWPHPHFFNVRYEIQNAIALVFALLFFRRRHWPLLAATFGAAMLVESLAALWVKFGMGLTGWSFFAEGGGIQSVVLSMEDLAGLAGGRFRLSGTMGHKNLLAAFFVLLLPLFALESLRRYPLRGLVVIIPALMTLAMTDSMTGWGATAMLLVIALVYLRRLDYLAIFGLLLLPLGAVALVRFGDSIFYRIQQLFGGEEGWGTVSSRFEMLRISRDLIAEHPWMGIGRANFMDYGMTYFTHAHNLVLMKMIEMGVPGGLFFIGFLAAVMVRAWNALTLEADRLGREGEYYRMLGVWLGCLGLLAMNMFDYNYANFSLGPMFMAMLGILLAVGWGLDREDLERAGEATLIAHKR